MRLPTYLARVVRSVEIAPRMRRVTVAGEGLRGFEGGRTADERVKLLLPTSGEAVPTLPRLDGNGLRFPAGRPVPAMRTLTVRAFDPARLELDLDVALHDGGIVSDWAMGAAAGEVVGIAGPRGGYAVPAGAARVVIAGDEAALPAAATILERLPPGCSALVLAEVERPGDEIPLPAGAGQAGADGAGAGSAGAGRAGADGAGAGSAVEVRWLYRSTSASALVDAVRALDWPAADDAVAVWAAGEASSMRAIRQYLRDERKLPRERFQVAGYWRRSLTEDEALVYDRRAVEAAQAAGASANDVEDAGIY
jgi:NADPH-dependent ferric siderophore reductase